MLPSCWPQDPLGRFLYIYLHFLPQKSKKNVGKYTSPMDGMGDDIVQSV